MNSPTLPVLNVVNLFASDGRPSPGVTQHTHSWEGKRLKRNKHPEAEGFCNLDFKRDLIANMVSFTIGKHTSMHFSSDRE